MPAMSHGPWSPYMASLPLDANVLFMTVMATEDAARRPRLILPGGIRRARAHAARSASQRKHGPRGATHSPAAPGARPPRSPPASVGCRRPVECAADGRSASAAARGGGQCRAWDSAIPRPAPMDRGRGCSAPPAPAGAPPAAAPDHARSRRRTSRRRTAADRRSIRARLGMGRAPAIASQRDARRRRQIRSVCARL